MFLFDNWIPIDMKIYVGTFTTNNNFRWLLFRDYLEDFPLKTFKCEVHERYVIIFTFDYDDDYD